MVLQDVSSEIIICAVTNVVDCEIYYRIIYLTTTE